jgi:hypothetical protein
MDAALDARGVQPADVRDAGARLAPNCQFHGPLMSELYGQAAVIHQTLGLVGSIPTRASRRSTSARCPPRGGHKVAVRWILEGHHLATGILKHLG